MQKVYAPLSSCTRYFINLGSRFSFPETKITMYLDPGFPYLLILVPGKLNLVLRLIWSCQARSGRHHEKLHSVIARNYLTQDLSLLENKSMQLMLLQQHFIIK